MAVERQSSLLDNASLPFVTFQSLPPGAYSLWSSDCVELSFATPTDSVRTFHQDASVVAKDSSVLCTTTASAWPATASFSVSSFPTRLAAHLRSTANLQVAYTADCASFRVSSISLSVLQWRRKQPDTVKASEGKCDAIPSLASLVTSFPTFSSTELKGGSGNPDQKGGGKSPFRYFLGVNLKLRRRVLNAIQQLQSAFQGNDKQKEGGCWADNSELELRSDNGDDNRNSSLGETKRQAVQTSKHLMAGALAAMVSRTIVAPLERLKLEYLVRGATGHVLDTMNGIFHTEGLKGFWKGNGVNLLRTAPFKSINFYAYDMYRHRLLRFGNRTEVSNLERLAAGAVAGITATVICFPLDTLRTMMVAPGGEAFGGLPGCCKHLIQTEGFLGLYKGLLPAIVSIAPAGAVFYGAYDILKMSYLKSPEGKALIRARQRRAKERPDETSTDLQLGTIRTLVYGALAGACSETVTYPLEVVRRAQQMHSGVHKRNMVATMQALLAKGGIGAFYAGIVPSTMQVLPSAALSYFVYESAKVAFHLT